MSLFIAQQGAVWMLGGKPWRMSETAVDSMLDLFEGEGEAQRFNDLYSAAQAAYGSDFIPRTTSLRLVSSNTPQQIVWHMLSASVELEAAIAAKSMEIQP